MEDNIATRTSIIQAVARRECEELCGCRYADDTDLEFAEPGNSAGVGIGHVAIDFDGEPYEYALELLSIVWTPERAGSEEW